MTPTTDRAEAEKLYSVEGVDLEEAKRLKGQAKLDGWNAHIDHTGGDRYQVRVFGPRFWNGGPDPAA